MNKKNREKTTEIIEKAYLNIGIFDCWKCKKDIKVAWIITDSTFYGPERFSDNEILKARSKGVKIEQVTSKTLGGEKYMANICTHCGSFIGEFFIHNYLNCEEYKEEI